MHPATLEIQKRGARIPETWTEGQEAAGLRYSVVGERNQGGAHQDGRHKGCAGRFQEAR
jgi:hypothetical protein